MYVVARQINTISLARVILLQSKSISEIDKVINNKRGRENCGYDRSACFTIRTEKWMRVYLHSAKCINRHDYLRDDLIVQTVTISYLVPCAVSNCSVAKYPEQWMRTLAPRDCIFSFGVKDPRLNEY